MDTWIVINEDSIKISRLPGDAIRYKNFEGVRWGDGKRDFTIDIDHDNGIRAEDLGWTCLSWKHEVWNDPDSEVVPCLKIKIGNYRPEVYYVGQNGKRNQVPFEQIDIDHIDKRPIEWISIYAVASDNDSGGRHYHTAYLSEISIKFKASPFAEEFGEAY